MSRGKIVFNLSGSIACYKACDAISKLVQLGYEVQTVATDSALRFVGAATLEGLTGRPVLADVFARGSAMEHIDLAKWADLTILAPASANTIGKLANGLADDFVSTLFLAHDFRKPYLVAPAMNSNMYAHPAVAANVEKLKTFGVNVLATGEGRLACGDVGEGRLLEPSQLVAAIETALAKRAAALSRKVLITSGGTREAIDGVRAITNTSSGRTGATLADELVARGHDVVYLHAATAALPSTKSTRLTSRTFDDFASLDSAMTEELARTKFDAVIHAAAVSDYSIASIEAGDVKFSGAASGKLDSAEAISIRLEKNPKIVDSIKSRSSNPSVRVAAFKLTNTEDANERVEAVRKLEAHARPDLVVHNDLNEITESRHSFDIWRGREVTKAEGAVELARRLGEWLEGGQA